jgi:AAT family amino acid transporter/GABA permease
VPARSVLIGTIAGVLGIMADALAHHYAIAKTVFGFLINAAGALIVFVYLLICLAQIALRRRRQREGTPEPALRMWLFPWASYGAIAGMIAVLVAMAATPDTASQFYVSVLALLIAAGACFLVLRRRRQSGRA